MIDFTTEIEAIGFTGSRKGSLLPQKNAFRAWMREVNYHRFHQGCCIGWDAEAVDFLHNEIVRPQLIGHPGHMKWLTDTLALERCDFVRAPKDCLARNEDIVNESNHLVACPRSMVEEVRGGTWATIRYARKQQKPITIFWPDGTASDEITSITKEPVMTKPMEKFEVGKRYPLAYDDAKFVMRKGWPIVIGDPDLSRGRLLVKVPCEWRFWLTDGRRVDFTHTQDATTVSVSKQPDPNRPDPL